MTSIVPHAVCVNAVYQFWKFGGEKQARKVFQHGLWYLPVLMGLMMFHKQGMDWGSWIGLGKDDEEQEAMVGDAKEKMTADSASV